MQKTVCRDRVLLEKKINLLLKGANLSDHAHIIGEKKDYIQEIINDPKSLEGRYFTQIFVEPDFTKKLYEGVILEVVSKQKVWNVTLIYGKANDLKRDEYEFTLNQVLADFILGDLEFL